MKLLRDPLSLFAWAVLLWAACLTDSAIAASGNSPALLPARPSIWPGSDGYEIRSSQLRLRYSADGRLLQAEEAMHAGTKARPVVYALPAGPAGEAVGLGALPADRSSPRCLRHSGPEGTWTELQLRRSNYENIILDPPPPGPRIPDYLDDATEAHRIARDADGILYALREPNTGPLLAYAADCEPLDVSAHVQGDTIALAARAEISGAYLVQRTDQGRSIKLQRFSRLQPIWAWSSDTLAGFDAAEHSARVWALADGGALLALQRWTSGQIELLRLADDGRVLANARIAGQQVAALSERGQRIVLAVLRGSDTVVLALDSGLALQASRELASLRVHGSVASAEHGLISPYWLVSNQGGVLGRAPWIEGVAYAVVHADVDPGISDPSPLQVGRRPLLVEASGAVLLMEEANARWDLLRLRPDGSEQRLPPPQTPDPARSAGWASHADAYGALGLAPGPEWASLRFSAWDTQGRALWTRELPGHLGSGSLLLSRVSEQAPSCLVYLAEQTLQGRLACYASIDGERLFDRALPRSRVDPWVHAGHVDAEGHIRLVLQSLESASADYALTLVSADRGGALTEESLGVSASNPRDWGASMVQDGRVVVVAEGSAATRVLSVDLETGMRTGRVFPGGASAWRVVAVDSSGNSLLLESERGGANRLTGLQVLDADLQTIGRPEISGSWLAEQSTLSIPGAVWAIDTHADRVLMVVPQDAAIGLHAFPISSAATPQHLQLPSAGRPHWLQLAPSQTGGRWQIAAMSMDGLELRGFDVQALRVSPVMQVKMASGLGPSAAFRSWRLSPQGLWTLRQHAETGSAMDAPPLQAAMFAEHRPIGPEHSGLWYDPQATGQGLMLDVEAASQRWFAAWFTFGRPSGLDGTVVPRLRAGVRWYSMLGQGNADAGLPIVGRLYSTRGGQFEGGSPQTVEQGQVFLQAIDCYAIEFSYAIPDAERASTATLSGTRRLQRIGPVPAACGGEAHAEQSGLSSASTGTWVLEGRPNQGLLMQIDPGASGRSGAVWGAWFGFDAGEPDDASAQHWLTLNGRSVPGQPGLIEFEWMRTLGGSFDSQPTHNTRVIGTGRLRFVACDRAVLEYDFDAPGLLGDAFAGLQGQVVIRRFDRCR